MRSRMSGRLPRKSPRVWPRARGLYDEYTPHNGFLRHVIDNSKA
jgi:hypothetical protein